MGVRLQPGRVAIEARALRSRSGKLLGIGDFFHHQRREVRRLQHRWPPSGSVSAFYPSFLLVLSGQSNPVGSRKAKWFATASPHPPASSIPPPPPGAVSR